MNVDDLIKRIKSHPEYDRVGMILTHVGVVRGFSRDGRKVTGIELSVDHGRVEQVIADQIKRHPGIIEILVEITDQGHLGVGDDIMAVVVAGDVRENVLATMSDTIDSIKQTVTRKTENYG